MTQDRQYHMPRRTPEHPPRGVEGGADGEFSDMLAGAIELSSLSPTTPIGFIEIAMEEMEKYGLELNDYRAAAILKPALGLREEARERISGMTDEAFSKTYPGVYGDLVRWYISEPSPEE